MHCQYFVTNIQPINTNNKQKEHFHQTDQHLPPASVTLDTDFNTHQY